MAKKKKKKVARRAAASKTAVGTKKRGAKKAAGGGKRQRACKKPTQPRSWRRVCRLAQDALAALEAGNVHEIRGYLEAIQAVGVCADEAEAR